MSSQSGHLKNACGLARALWHVAPGRCEIRTAPLPARAPDQVLVRTLFSGLSRGTERLVAEGRVPESEAGRMRAPLQEGEFPFPVKYGYCAVGEALEGPPELAGRRVFVLHPHQDLFIAPAAMAVALPDGLPSARAVLAANMETALNALWDSAAGPGDRIAVFGGGAVGALICFLAAGLPGADVTLVDPEPARGAIAAAFGARFSTRPDAVADVDVAFNASASSAGLAAALAACGREATLVEASWYGAKSVEAPLGAAFHSRRLKIVSTQVGDVSPGRRPRWTHARRMAKALELLQDDRLDLLLTSRVAFDDLPRDLPRLLSAGAEGIAAIVAYS